MVLTLKCETSREWVAACLNDVDAVLVDHAHCEHKAAITALSFVSKYPDDPRLVRQLSALAAEEAEHFARMVALCTDRGLGIGHPGRDPYAKQLLQHTRPGQLTHRVDRLLICALIEARSCERLKLLAENLAEPDLVALYDELWRVEAGHHVLFVQLAEHSHISDGDTAEVAKQKVRERLDDLCDIEAELIRTLPVRPAIH